MGKNPPETAIFRTQQTHQNVYLAVILYHTLRGDYDEALEVYQKTEVL